MNKKLLRLMLATTLAAATLSMTACGPFYEGSATITEKEERTKLMPAGKVTVPQRVFYVTICPEEPASQDASEVECFETRVQRHRYSELEIGQVVEYDGRSITNDS